MGPFKKWSEVDYTNGAERLKNASRLSQELRLYVGYSRAAGHSLIDIMTSVSEGARDEWNRAEQESGR